MTEDNNRSVSASTTPNSASDAHASTPQKSLEDLLIDNDTPKKTFRDLADQEVKSGKCVDNSLYWPFVVLILLIVAVFGVVIAWYQFGDLMSGQPGAGDQVRVEKRMAVPERLQPQEVAQQTSATAVQDGDTKISAQTETNVVADVVTQGAAEVDTGPLRDATVLSAMTPSAVSEEDVVETVLIAADVVATANQQVAAEPPATPVAEAEHLVLVGPFISRNDLERAATLLRERGFEPEQQYGSGTVDMIRLLEGIYPLAQAQQRLEEVRKDFSSAFLLPDGGRWALYIGSFSDRDRARRQQRELAERQIQVVPVDSQLTMEGSLLIVARSGLQAAEEVAAEVNASGLRARIEIER